MLMVSEVIASFVPCRFDDLLLRSEMVIIGYLHIFVYTSYGLPISMVPCTRFAGRVDDGGD